MPSEPPGGRKGVGADVHPKGRHLERDILLISDPANCIRRRTVRDQHRLAGNLHLEPAGFGG